MDNFLNKLKNIVEESKTTKTSKEIESFLEDCATPIREICSAMVTEIDNTAALLHYSCFDKDGNARTLTIDETLNITSQHGKIYEDICARIDNQVKELNRVVYSFTGNPLFENMTTLEYADKIIADLGNVTKQEMWQFSLLANDKKDEIDKNFLYGKLFRKMPGKTLDKILQNLTISSQNVLKEYMLYDKLPEISQRNWGTINIKENDYTCLNKIEELYHAVEKIPNTKNREALVKHIQNSIRGVFDAFGGEIENSGSLLLNTLIELEAKEESENPQDINREENIAKLLAAQLNLKSETDEKIYGLINDLQNGAKNVLNIDLLNGNNPIEWAEKLTNEIHCYGKALEHAREVENSKKKNIKVVIPKNLPFFEKFFDENEKLISKYKINEELSIRNTILTGGKKIPTHSVIVRKAPEIMYENIMNKTGEDKEAAKIMDCMLPVLDDKTKKISIRPISAYYIKEQDAYYVGEADYKKAVKGGTPTIPVIIEGGKQHGGSDFSNLTDASILKMLFDYSSNMSDKDRKTIIDGILTNKEISEIDSNITHPTPSNSFRDTFVITGHEKVGNIIQNITNKNPRGYLMRYLTGMGNIHGSEYLKDQIHLTHTIQKMDGTGQKIHPILIDNTK